MITNMPKHTYSITLPVNTTKDIFEWFTIMDNNKQLAEKLIELVHSDIMTGDHRNTQKINLVTSSELKIDGGEDLHRADFMNSLYNWEESTSAIFNDCKEEKREKC